MTKPAALQKQDEGQIGVGGGGEPVNPRNLESVWNQRKVVPITAASACTAVCKVVAAFAVGIFTLVSLVPTGLFAWGAIIINPFTDGWSWKAGKKAISAFYDAIFKLQQELLGGGSDELTLSRSQWVALKEACDAQGKSGPLKTVMLDRREGSDWFEAWFNKVREEKTDRKITAPINAFALLRLQKALFNGNGPNRLSSKQQESIAFLKGTGLPCTHEKEEDTYYSIDLAGSTVEERLQEQREDQWLGNFMGQSAVPFCMGYEKQGELRLRARGDIDRPG